MKKIAPIAVLIASVGGVFLATRNISSSETTVPGAQEGNTGNVNDATIADGSPDATVSQPTDEIKHFEEAAKEDPAYQKQMAATWFVAPQFASEKKYSDTPVELQWDDSCKSNASFGTADFATLLKTDAGISGTQQFARDLHVILFSQFWKRENVYYQLSANWLTTYPPTYRIEYFSSEQPDMRGPAAKTLPTIQNAESADIETAYQFVEKELAAEKQKGAVEGARIVQFQTAPKKSDSNTSWHNALFINGMPTQYVRGKLTCTTDLTNNAKGACRCENK